ncbi:coiled-coil domain-containing protein 43 isoform X2 [Microtus oregoni]|uniref:coiled-coil domain-containing protein 43 isoform X2 n=1 Tax=Microtus oregoni TaxID=111838 RepID=UPI001BB288FF|nr:coiled-coil domain-containing protein 43 isoform X2 [Microtus oregoni]
MAGVLAPGWTDGWRRWEWTEPFTALTSLVSCGMKRRKRSWTSCKEEDSLLDICKEIVERWSETQSAITKVKKEDEVQAIATLIEKQAQIVVKPRMVSEEERQRKAALLAQYADVTDEEDEADEKDDPGTSTANIGSDKFLFRNTNVEDVLNARKLERDSLRDESQRKKEQDKLQREKDKLAKQERKEKEKKRTQRGERKR